MGCLSSGDLKEEKTEFALSSTIYRIPVLSSRKLPRSLRCWLVCDLARIPSFGWCAQKVVPLQTQRRPSRLWCSRAIPTKAILRDCAVARPVTIAIPSSVPLPR